MNKAGTGKHKKRCLHCKKYGHLAEDCALSLEVDGIDMNVKICYKCGSSEHTLKDCRKRADNLEFAVCYVCNEKGKLFFVN